MHATDGDVPDEHVLGRELHDAVGGRQRLWSDYGFAAFVDAGQASASRVPFNGSIQVGAGLGARYYTSIGAIRADVAVPLTRVPKGDAFEIYLSLGQAF